MMMLLGPDAIIASRYKLLQKLGEGGFAIVYKAQDLDLGRTVAIKFLKAEGHDSENMQRFLREARLIASVSHPNVVSVYAIDVLENENMPYIVMEYLDGESLASRVSRLGALSADECNKLFFQLCDGLNQLHENNILHRDISSNNVFLCNVSNGEPVPKIIDLGLSKALVNSSSNTDKKLTATGLLIGNPSFMSPEQARAEALDKRSDIYSLACVFYTAVYGSPPFDADTPVALLYKHQNQEARFPPLKWRDQQAANRVIDSLRVAMNKDANARFQSCPEFAAALSGDAPLPVRSAPASNRLAITVVLLSGLMVLALLPAVYFTRKKSAEPVLGFHKVSQKRSNLSLRMRKPSSFIDLLEIAGDFAEQGHEKEALDLLNSFTNAFSLSPGEKQILNMRKLSLFAALGMQKQADATEELLYSDPTITKNSLLTANFVDYMVSKDPAKCIVICEHWQKNNPDNRSLRIELAKLRALVFCRKYAEAKKLIPSFDYFDLKLSATNETALSELEELILVIKSGLGEKVDLVKGCKEITEANPRRRLHDEHKTYLEVANLCELSGSRKEAVTLLMTAARKCETTNPEAAKECFRKVFSEKDFWNEFPSEVIEAANGALKLGLTPVEAYPVRNVLIHVYCNLKKYDLAKKLALENYDWFLQAYGNKPEWSAVECRYCADIMGGLTRAFDGDQNRDELIRLSEQGLVLFQKHKEAASAHVEVLLNLVRSVQWVDHERMGSFSRRAADQLILISPDELPNSLSRKMPLIESLFSAIPPVDQIYCFDHLLTAYSQAFPGRAKPLKSLSSLVYSYSVLGQMDNLRKLYPVISKSLIETDFSKEQSDITSVIFMVRTIENSPKFADFESVLAKTGSAKNSPVNRAVASLVLADFYLDVGRTTDFENTFSKFRLQLKELSVRDPVYAQLRKCSLLQALRTQKLSDFVNQQLAEVKGGDRLRLFLEFSEYFQHFGDLGVCVKFLDEHKDELRDNSDSDVLVLNRVRGDCYHLLKEFARSESLYRAVLADYEKRKSLSGADAVIDRNLVLLEWGLFDALQAQNKFDESLELYKNLGAGLLKFRIREPKVLREFAAIWQAAATKFGDENDLMQVEKFKNAVAVN